MISPVLTSDASQASAHLNRSTRVQIRISGPGEENDLHGTGEKPVFEIETKHRLFLVEEEIFNINDRDKSS